MRQIRRVTLLLAIGVAAVTAGVLSGSSAFASQPDLKIKGFEETHWLGEDLHNLTALGQVKDVPNVLGRTAVFELSVQNDGGVADSFIIQGPAALGGWTIAYFDALSRGTNVTAQVTGVNGWRVGPLAPGASADFHMEVTLPRTRPALLTLNAFVSAVSAGDRFSADTVKATSAISGEPDLMIRQQGDVAWIGELVFSDNPAAQERVITTAKGTTVVFEFRLDNATITPDTLAVHGPADAGGWTIQYFDSLVPPGNDVTADVTGPTGWNVGAVPPFGSVFFRAEVTVPAGALSNSKASAFILAESVVEPGHTIDTALATTLVAADVDTRIRVPGEVAWTGDNEYSASGSRQEAVQFSPGGTVQTFELSVQNDGVAATSFLVRGPAGAGGWRLRYFDALTGGNAITASVTDPGGWDTGVLAPGASRDFRVRVIVPAGATSSTFPINAQPSADPTNVDEVLATVRTLAQPDMTAVVFPDVVEYGANIYSATAVGEEVSASVPFAKLGLYQMAVTNRGNAPQSFIVRGPATAAGWRLSYFDDPTRGKGVNITAPVTGAGGWPTGVLAPGAKREFRLEVFPGPALPVSLTHSALVTAEAVGDPLQIDAIRANTQITTEMDMWIRRRGDAGWVGVFSFDPTGESEVRRVTRLANQTVVYELTVSNAGDIPDVAIIRGPGDTNGFTIQYFDDVAPTGVDITAAVTSPGGWVTPTIPALGLLRLRALVTAPAVAPLNASFPALISAIPGTDAANPEGFDAVIGLTVVAAQPDMLIRLPAAAPAWVGDGVYNIDGTNQTQDRRVGASAVATYDLAVQNDAGADPDSFVVRGAGDASGWTVKYFDSLVGGTDITSLVVGAGWPTGPIAAGANVPIRVEITAPTTFSVGSRAVPVTATSVTDPTALDTVVALATANLGRRPDGLVKLATEALWTGDNVYNTTGLNQTKRLTVLSATLARYRVGIQNDGTAADTIAVAGPASDADWTLTYFDAPTGGTDVTAAVTGPGGLAIGPLAPGAVSVLRIEVLPRFGLPDGTAKTVAITARSVAVPARTDVVRTITTTGTPVVLAAGATTAQVSGLAAIPTAGGAQIVFSLAAAADVDARVLNMAGRTVRSLVIGKASTQGANTLLWNTQSDRGLRVPNGTYLVEVTARSAEGGESKALTAVRINR